jgi:hypothetical protein
MVRRIDQKQNSESLCYDCFFSFLPKPSIGAVKLNFLVAFRGGAVTGGVLPVLAFALADAAMDEGGGNVVLRD